MKKHLIVSIASLRRGSRVALGLLAAGLLLTTALRAQGDVPEPCTPDCPGSGWGSPKTKQLPAPAPFQTCFVTVTYVDRLACGVYQDIQILRVDIPFNAACQAFINWLVDPANHNQNAVGNYITRLHNIFSIALISAKFKTWYEDPATSPTERAQAACGQNGNLGVQRWRVVRGSCWYNYLNPCNCRYEVRPCPNEVCCLKAYYLCWDPETGKPRVTYEGNAVPTSPCPLPPAEATPGSVVSGDGHCFQSCDDDGIDEGIQAAAARGGSDPSISALPRSGGGR